MLHIIHYILQFFQFLLINFDIMGDWGVFGRGWFGWLVEQEVFVFVVKLHFYFAVRWDLLLLLLFLDSRWWSTSILWWDSNSSWMRSYRMWRCSSMLLLISQELLWIELWCCDICCWNISVVKSVTSGHQTIIAFLYIKLRILGLFRINELFFMDILLTIATDTVVSIVVAVSFASCFYTLIPTTPYQYLWSFSRISRLFGIGSCMSLLSHSSRLLLIISPIIYRFAIPTTRVLLILVEI